MTRRIEIHPLAVTGERWDELSLLPLARGGHAVAKPTANLVAPSDEVGRAHLVDAKAPKGRNEAREHVAPALAALRRGEPPLSDLCLEQRCGVLAPMRQGPDRPLDAFVTLVPKLVPDPDCVPNRHGHPAKRARALDPAARARVRHPNPNEVSAVLQPPDPRTRCRRHQIAPTHHPAALLLGGTHPGPLVSRSTSRVDRHAAPRGRPYRDGRR
jgi:hypothetical protein